MTPAWTSMRAQSGFSLVELLVAAGIMMVIILAVFAAYAQGSLLAGVVHADARIIGSTRIGMENLERELRMIGFNVPEAAQIGGTALWTPFIITASPTRIGFRADVDGGNSLIRCTPSGSSATCPQNRVLVDDLDYYQDLNCKKPDDPLTNMPLVLIAPDERWEPATCTSFFTSNNSLATAANVTNNAYVPGNSRVATVEQVYYRYTAGTAPSYGRLERHVTYANTPSSTVPSTGWTLVADHLTNVSFSYEDASNVALTGNPLTSAQNAAVSRIIVNMEGIDDAGPDVERRIRMRSEIYVRNMNL